jgi:hypothetical protein
MPALMPRDVLFDTALLRYCFDAVLAVGVTGNWQQFVPFGHAVVFLDDVSAFRRTALQVIILFH